MTAIRTVAPVAPPVAPAPPADPAEVDVVLLGAGNATRLSPLTAPRGKLLVPFDGRPLLAYQLTTLIRAGYRRFCVVVAPCTRPKSEEVLEAAFELADVTVAVAVQEEPLGPGHALAVAATSGAIGERPVLTLLADTLVEPVSEGGSWVAVARPPAARRWAVVEHTADGTVLDVRDELAAPGEDVVVAVGMYRFDDPELLVEVCERQLERLEWNGDELELSAVLAAYGSARPLRARSVSSWQDCGDLESLRSARRLRLPGRAFNRLVLVEPGVVRKESVLPGIQAEARFLRDLEGPRAQLFPRVLDVGHDCYWYELEYVDLPTLAELYLFTKASVSFWEHTLATLLATLRDRLWRCDEAPSRAEVVARARRMYVGKLEERFELWTRQSALARHDELLVNGRRRRAGAPCVRALAERLDDVSERVVPGIVHGDLHFSNVLLSLTTGAFKLLDPRGDFGGEGPLGDVRYELAKLRHSYAGCYDAVVRDLFVATRESSRSLRFEVGTKRATTAAALDAVLSASGADLDDVRAIEASLYLSMIPLHDDDPDRQRVLYALGLEATNALLYD